MRIRDFHPDDAEFCFRIRCTAFIVEFLRELGPPEVAAAVNAYMPRDYVEMAVRNPFFVVELDEDRAGFVTVRQADTARAEIPLLYVHPDRLREGIGRTCVRHVESWLSSNWGSVTTLFLDTVVPKYNGSFYAKMGFEPVARTRCWFPDAVIPAVRYEKSLAAQHDTGHRAGDP